MKKWQEERNYRRVRSEAGEVIANIITVDGMDVEVPEDVYLAYSQADRRERYITEEQSSGKLLSLEQMEEDALLPDYVGAETAPSAETEALEREELRNLAEQKQILLLALLSLKDTDRELINALFFDGASTREYAREGLAGPCPYCSLFPPGRALQIRWKRKQSMTEKRKLSDEYQR